jgi:hypothetical protein
MALPAIADISSPFSILPSCLRLAARVAKPDGSQGSPDYSTVFDPVVDRHSEFNSDPEFASSSGMMKRLRIRSLIN